MLLQKYQKDYKLITEANEICQAMKKNMKFKPQLTKQAYDSSGRKMTLTDQNAGSNKYQEELLIMVEDKENKMNFMLEIDDFKDKLDMMRNAYAQF